MAMLRGMRAAAPIIWIIVFVAFVGGFLVLDTSGLLGSGGLTPTTRVAKVNGHSISYGDWSERLQAAQQQATQGTGRSLTMDETRELEGRVLEEMIMEILLDEEYRRRGITVSDEEIIRAAEMLPHPDLMRSPEMQTDGRFDPEKYRRFLSAPSTRAGGYLVYLENFYRTEVPRRKLLEQIISDVHVTDTEMWNKWREVYDSVQVSYVAFTPEMHPDSIPVPESEVRAFYEENKETFKQRGRANVSLLHVPKVITAADTASARERISTLRAEIAAGNDSTFEIVTRRESDDTRSAPTGGDMPRGVRGQYFGPAFDSAAFALRVGQLSQPVLTPFGFHLIKVMEKKADTIHFRHLLVEVRQSDSVALALDRRADSLASLAGEKTDPRSFDETAAKLALQVRPAMVFEGQPLVHDGKYVPSVSAWAFSGVRPGETSMLFDADEGFWLARLDTLVQEGIPPLNAVRDVIAKRLENKKKLEALRDRAAKLAQAATTSSLESAAAAAGITVQKTPVFSRVSFVQGIGQDNEAIGAAFALSSGSVSVPIMTDDALFVLRVDKRWNADREAWARQRDAQRTLLLQSMQQSKIQSFLRALRESATVVDERKKLNEMGREAAAIQEQQNQQQQRRRQ